MKPIVVLTLVGVISALLLSYVYDVTKEPIAEAKAKMKREAIQKIFPFTFDSLRTNKTEKAVFYEAYDAELNIKGIAVETSTDKGYSGNIEVLVGVSMACEVYNYKVLAHAETPGLGDKIDKDKFKAQFKGKGLEGVVWKVKKDDKDGFVDELTAATISSRAVTEAVYQGLKLVSEEYPKLSDK